MPRATGSNRYEGGDVVLARTAPALAAFAALAALISACSPTFEAAGPMPAEQLQPAGDIVSHRRLIEPAPVFKQESGVILPEATAAGLARQCSRPSPGPVTGAWTPALADIDKLEAALPDLLAEKLATEPDTAASNYYRQYAGLVLGDRPVIYVNGVHDHIIEDAPPPGTDWRRQPVGLCDGGSLSFGVEYDPATGAFDNFAFNGKL